MIDFNNASYLKLGYWNQEEAAADLATVLVPGEQIHLAFRGVRDSVTFTDKRIIALNVQGITGKKKDYTTLPYSKVQVFSVETAGTIDLDSELVLWFSGLGRIKLEFNRQVDIRGVGRLLADKTL